jgi:hypothetical protein
MLRFTVHSPARRRTSPRSHRMPCGDVPGCVYVRDTGISTGPAGEDGLTRARLRIYSPARAAALRGTRGINLLHPADGFLLESARQQSPATSANGPIQSSFLPDGLHDSAPGRAGHAKDVQFRKADDTELASQAGGRLLSPIPIDSYHVARSRARKRRRDHGECESPDVIGIDRDHSEPLVLYSLSPRGLAVRASEVVRRGLGEVPQRLLLDQLTTSGQPWARCAGHGQLRCLYAITRCAPATWAPPRRFLAANRLLTRHSATKFNMAPPANSPQGTIR